MLEYSVSARRIDHRGSEATTKDATIVLDTDVNGRPDAFNPAELFLAALAACMIKGIERAIPILKFDLHGVEVKLHGVRQDSPPMMVVITYELIVDTERNRPPPRSLARERAQVRHHLEHGCRGDETRRHDPEKGMMHDHADHAVTVRDFGPAFRWGVGSNSAYVAIEAGYGFARGSLALLADATHNLTDVAGLLLAWGAATLSWRMPSAGHTYGLGRASISGSAHQWRRADDRGGCARVGGDRALFGTGARFPGVTAWSPLPSASLSIPERPCCSCAGASTT